MKRKMRRIYGLMLILMLFCFGITAEAATQKTMYVGKTYSLQIKNGKQWTSSNKAIIKVTQKGRVTPLRPGTAKVTVKKGKKKVTFLITSKSPFLSKKSLTLRKGQSQKIKLNGAASSKWHSSNPKVATVSNGKITAVKSGTAKITCTDKNNKKYTCRITVKNPMLMIQSAAQVQNPSGITLLAHRGASIEAPENTMSAFRLAEKKGCRAIETDLCFTKDNVPVLMHDGTINRTSNRSGNVSSYTYFQIRKLDFGSWKSKKYKNEKIPTLDEFFQFCSRKNITPYVELKPRRGYTKAKLLKAYRIAQKYHIERKTIWFSGDITYIKWIKSIDPAAQIGYLYLHPVTKEIVGRVAQLKNRQNQVYINATITKYSEEIIKLCKKKGVKIIGGFVSKQKLKDVDPYFTSVVASWW